MKWLINSKLFLSSYKLSTRNLVPANSKRRTKLFGNVMFEIVYSGGSGQSSTGRTAAVCRFYRNKINAQIIGVRLNNWLNFYTNITNRTIASSTSTLKIQNQRQILCDSRSILQA